MKNAFIIGLLSLCICTINSQEIRGLFEMFDDNVFLTQIDPNGIGEIYTLKNNFSFREDFTKLAMEIIPLKIWENNGAMTFFNFEISWNSVHFFPILSNFFGKYDFIGPVASINSFGVDFEAYMNSNSTLLTFGFKLENIKRNDAYFKGIEFGYKNYKIDNKTTNGFYITLNLERKKLFEKICIVIMI